MKELVNWKINVHNFKGRFPSLGSQITIIIGPCRKSKMELYRSRHVTSFQPLSDVYTTPPTSEQLFFKAVVLKRFKKFPVDNLYRRFFKRENDVGFCPEISRKFLEEILHKTTRIATLGTFIDVSNSGWKNSDKTVHFFQAHCSVYLLRSTWKKKTRQK